MDAGAIGQYAFVILILRGRPGPLRAGMESAPRKARSGCRRALLFDVVPQQFDGRPTA